MLAGKLRRLEELCETLGVRTRPARVGGVWVVPLLSWYHASFDAEPDIEGARPVDQVRAFAHAPRNYCGSLCRQHAGHHCALVGQAGCQPCLQVGCQAFQGMHSTFELLCTNVGRTLNDVLFAHDSNTPRSLFHCSSWCTAHIMQFFTAVLGFTKGLNPLQYMILHHCGNPPAILNEGTLSRRRR